MIRLLPVLAIALQALCFVAPAYASGDGGLADAPPIRDAHPWRAERHQITPTLGFSIVDPYQRSLLAGVNYRYYFYNWLGVGLDAYGTYLNLDTTLTKDIEGELSGVGQTGRPSAGHLRAMITAAVTFVPFYGKSMLFGRYPVAYDFHIMLGAGYAATTGTGRISTGSAFAPVVGVGARFFASEWISVDLGVRDYIVNMPLVAPAAVVNPESTFVQNFMVTIGVSFFFPPEFERTP